MCVCVCGVLPVTWETCHHVGGLTHVPPYNSRSAASPGTRLSEDIWVESLERLPIIPVIVCSACERFTATSRVLAGGDAALS